MADIKETIKFVKDHAEILKHNKILFDIYEGDLYRYIEADLQEQLSPQAFAVAKTRISPINILRRIVDKLSKLYIKPVSRTIVNGTEQDQKLLDWYCEQMKCDVHWNIANELFNLHKTVTVEPYLDQKGIPKMRAIPSDRSIFKSDDKIDPTNPTQWIKIMGSSMMNGRQKTKLFIYTDEQFIPVNEDGSLLVDVLQEMDNPEGINPFGKIPAVYINRSYHNIVPPIDSDVLKMTKLVPILLSDLSYAILFQSFSILYGIDIDQENLKVAPNVFWNFKSDKTSDKTPQIGSIKPEVNITEVVQYIQSLITLWLNSKNIRPGTVGGLAAENIASGISKIIDEMDTVEDRQKQVAYFQKGETEFWDLIINHMHPYWLQAGMIDTKQSFSVGAQVLVEFPEQLPLTQRSEVLKDVVIELDKELTTKKVAIKTLNPEMNDKAIDEFLAEIEAEHEMQMPEPQQLPPIQQDQGMIDGREAVPVPSESEQQVQQ